jgi:hypothetical protein
VKCCACPSREKCPEEKDDIWLRKQSEEIGSRKERIKLD